jgi:hypothetical protein
MIVNSVQGDVEVLGNVKEFKTSIDPKNLEYITTLLSSNLYSDPEQSFIREIVSNAWDSHVEAGNTNVPVIIKFNTENKSITIRDYGVGLSPERFKDIFCNIGSSTKRESNDYIGGFGIGRFASLACSNTVYITSYYNGTAYYYVMCKSGNSITTNLLMEKLTDEKNGVEISIKNIYDFHPYIEALSYIVFFPNVYIQGCYNADEINNSKIKVFNNFAASSLRVRNKILLGNVLYPCNYYNLTDDSRNFLNRIENTGIVIKFNIGELNITPNRESIIYTPETKDIINTRIKEAEEEINSYIIQKFNKDFDDILEYYRCISESAQYDPITDSIVDCDGYKIQLCTIPNINITYKGKDYSEYIQFLAAIFRRDIPNYKGLLYRSNFYLKRRPWDASKYERLDSPRFLILNEGAKFTETVKSFVKENYISCSIMSGISLKNFLLAMKSSYSCFISLNKQVAEEISIAIYESINKRADYLDLTTDKDFIEFKKRLKSDNKVSPLKETILYNCSYNYRERRYYKTFLEALNYLQSLHKGIILTEIGDRQSFFYTIAKFKGYIYIQAKKEVVARIRKLNPTYLVDTDWLLYKDPTLSLAKTVYNTIVLNDSEGFFRNLLNIIPKNLSKEFLKIRTIYSTYCQVDDYVKVACSDNIPIDSYTEEMCTKFKEYLSIYRRAYTLVKEECRFSGDLLIAAVIMKQKTFRINYTTYKDIKNNKLLSILCTK